MNGKTIVFFSVILLAIVILPLVYMTYSPSGEKIDRIYFETNSVSTEYNEIILKAKGTDELNATDSEIRVGTEENKTVVTFVRDRGKLVINKDDTVTIDLDAGYISVNGNQEYNKSRKQLELTNYRTVFVQFYHADEGASLHIETINISQEV
jgi:ABC-type Na+ efflux pump permease subunit